MLNARDRIAIRNGTAAVTLAPMEGVTDAPMRAFLTERGGFDFCVSEFLRISQNLLPERVYHEHVPELKHGCRTPSGTPIQFQFLGGDAVLLAESAAFAYGLGVPGIDLNFGCPAPTVNRHDGGATLLKYPHRIRSIVQAVRNAVPGDVPVSAKLRLGWDDPSSVLENALMAEEGGADWITIHARTKMQGYTPPAHWQWLGEVKKRLTIPLVANGEIWTTDDLRKCREISGCEHFMLGRGALADPSLAIATRSILGILKQNEADAVGTEIAEWLPMIRRFGELTAPYNRVGADYAGRRVKQWIKMASVPRRIPWFDLIKTAANFDEIVKTLAGAVPSEAAPAK